MTTQTPADELRAASKALRAAHATDPFRTAVADWLDHEATRLTNLMPQWRNQWDDNSLVIAALRDGMFRHQLAIARAYLGTTEQVTA